MDNGQPLKGKLENCERRGHCLHTIRHQLRSYYVIKKLWNTHTRITVPMLEVSLKISSL